MNLVEEILLQNGLTVAVWDKSIPIASDTTKVSLVITVKVPLEPSYFTGQDEFETVRRILGSEIFFEYKKERTFVKDKDKDSVFQELLTNFKKNSLGYLGRSTFPRSFAVSKYRDMQKNSYKYGPTGESR
ncbi:MAG TPA: hypothetical protein VLZ07_11550 [Syntrophales bacterium]|nr:hypothetical protein [Syntrophales bacterium]